MQSFTQLIPQISAELLPYFSWLGERFEQVAWYLPFLLLLAISGTCAFLVSGRSLAVTSRRTSYDKGARQIALLAVVSGWIALFGAGGWFFWRNGYELPPDWDIILVLSALLPAVLVLLLTLALLFWKFTGKHRVFWWLNGLLLVVAGTATLLWSWCLLRGLSQGISFAGTGDIVGDALALGRDFLSGFGIQSGTQGSLGEIRLWDLEAFLVSPHLAMTCSLLPLFFAIPAVFASFGFLALRSVHDYGRDHYAIVLTFSLRYAARFGFLLCCILAAFLGVQGYLQWERGWLTLLPLCSELLLFLVWLFVSLLFSVLSRSQYPLRHKVWVVLADCVALMTVVPLVGEWLR